MAPLSRLLTLLPIFRRQQHAPYMTVRTEPDRYFRQYPDSIAETCPLFSGKDTVNMTCWTLSSMLYDDAGHTPQSDNSYIWLWAQSTQEFEKKPDSILWHPGVGNVDQGGKAGGWGCWLHEWDVAKAGDIYFPDKLDWCGDAPHHQVAKGISDYPYLECRNCTDLSNPACQTSWKVETLLTPVGCWKEGTEVNGNSTWVWMLEFKCFVAPDQFSPTDWHGPPAGECDDETPMRP